MRFENTRAFAKRLDRLDPLRLFRSKFHLPQKNGHPAIYLTGNSLGLQPKTAKKFIAEELQTWASLGVEGHHEGPRPWLHYHHLSKNALARLVGAKPTEVTAMNQLTVNLHLMMASFYRPTKKRFKILTEAGAFSSDQYAFESQVKFHGLRPNQSIIEVSPRQGEYALRTADILAAIEAHKNELALVIFGAVQYYTGQFFDLKKITEAGHRAGAMVGFDLAHAIGNVPLKLHRDNVDFATWCGYKYLNSGPGGMSGIFVHERHARSFQLPRLAGWWGHLDTERFQMRKGFKPMPGSDGWQLSNFPILSGAAQLASLEIFEAAGLTRLRQKSLLLTDYLLYLLKSIPQGEEYFTVITPERAEARGCQLSLLMKKNGRAVFDKITSEGIIADWREPDVIRVAPVPLYNTFDEVFSFAKTLEHALR